MNRAWKVFAAGCVAVLALSGATAAAAKDKKGHSLVPRAVLAAVHADVTIINAQGQSQSVTWDKGKVTAKSDSALTLERKDGKSVSLAINQNTKIRVKDGSLDVGDMAIAFSREGSAFLILAVQAREGPPPASSASGAPSAAPKDRHRGLHRLFRIPRGAVHVGWALIMADGKTLALAFDAGEVTAKSDASITLKRADGVSVTLKLDDKTKIRKDGVSVGDRAVAISRDGTALIVLSGKKPEK
jgi:hypothetical protein